MGLGDKVRTLLRYLKQGGTRRTPSDRLLHFVLVDAKRSDTKASTLREVQKLGVQIVDVPLMTDASAPYLDDELLARALLSLA